VIFSELHWVPSAVAAILTILLVFASDRNKHRALSYAMAFSALVGLIGFVTGQRFDLFGFDVHTFHAWIGVAALLVSLYNFVRSFFEKKRSRLHCRIGYVAAVLSFMALLIGSLLLTGLVNAPTGFQNTVQVPASSTLPESEAESFQNVTLTPLRDQRNNAIVGTQHIDVTTYRLSVTGLVEDQLNLSYEDLLTRLPAYSQVAYMPCVEGWGFYAKWTGFRVIDLLEQAKLKTNATYVVFHSSDGYSTGLPLEYLRDKRVLMAFGINDVSLPPERGFPFQLVAVDKYGYKWAKWVTRIEVGDKEVEGYWESRGYNNNADAGGPPYG
jgi:DMSO/TMAO reductase YedYZ molybdopterin-dependent catalytic subunit